MGGLQWLCLDFTSLTWMSMFVYQCTSQGGGESPDCPEPQPRFVRAPQTPAPFFPLPGPCCVWAARSTPSQKYGPRGRHVHVHWSMLCKSFFTCWIGQTTRPPWPHSARPRPAAAPPRAQTPHPQRTRRGTPPLPLVPPGEATICGRPAPAAALASSFSVPGFLTARVCWRGGSMAAEKSKQREREREFLCVVLCVAALAVSCVLCLVLCSLCLLCWHTQRPSRQATWVVPLFLVGLASGRSGPPALSLGWPPARHQPRPFFRAACCPQSPARPLPPFVGVPGATPQGRQKVRGPYGLNYTGVYGVYVRARVNMADEPWMSMCVYGVYVRACEHACVCVWVCGCVCFAHALHMPTYCVCVCACARACARPRVCAIYIP